MKWVALILFVLGLGMSLRALMDERLSMPATVLLMLGGLLTLGISVFMFCALIFAAL